MKEEELRKAADEYTSSDKIRYIQDATDRDVEDAFVEGAEWALEHQWIDVNDRLPCYEADVIATNGEGSYWFAHRSERAFVDRDHNGFARIGPFVVTHWMPVPQLKIR